MVRDSVSELINGLKMASKAGKSTMIVKSSKLIRAIAETLKKEGFIAGLAEKGKAPQVWLEITLNQEKPVEGAKRMSSFSKRMYKGAHELLSNSRMKGVYILTTPKGVMTQKEAKKQNVGGELLFKMW